MNTALTACLLPILCLSFSNRAEGRAVVGFRLIFRALPVASGALCVLWQNLPGFRRGERTRSTRSSALYGAWLRGFPSGTRKRALGLQRSDFRKRCIRPLLTFGACQRIHTDCVGRSDHNVI